MLNQNMRDSFWSAVLSRTAAALLALGLTALAATRGDAQETEAETPSAAPEHAAEDAEHAADAAHADEAHAAADHGEHVDPYDLSHANASENLASPADLRYDLAVYTFVVFLLLLAVLYKFAWGPIAAGLEKRETGIAKKIEEAHLAASAAEARLKEYEAKLAEATAEARSIVSKAMTDAQRASEKIVAEAQERAAREQQRAMADIEVAKNVALESISQKSVDLAMSLAGRIIRKELNEADHAQLIRESLEKLPSRN